MNYLWRSLVSLSATLLTVYTSKWSIMDIQGEAGTTEDPKLGRVTVNELRVVLLDVLLPLLDILVDIAKALVLVLEDRQYLMDLDSSSNNYLQNGLLGLISIFLKWTPALVAGLHFQDMNR